MKYTIRNTFEHYYGLSDGQKKSIWKDCLFVLDTNVLLDLYRYSEDTKQEMLEVLTGLKNRLWLPYQVGYEFSKRRPKVILDQHSMIEKAKSVLKNIGDAADKEFREKLNFRDHPYINREEIKNKIQLSLDQIESELDEKIRKYPHSFSMDPVLETLEDIFTDRLGKGFDAEELAEIVKVGEDRYKKLIPPGFADSDKANNDDKYGDFIIWKEILKHAELESRHVVFVTSDNKEDWWWIEKGKKLGAHPMLVREFKECTNRHFIICNPDSFLDQGKKRLKLELSKSSVDEVKRISRRRQDIQYGKEGSLLDGSGSGIAGLLAGISAVDSNFNFTKSTLDKLRQISRVEDSIAEKFKGIENPSSAIARVLLDSTKKLESDRLELINSLKAYNIISHDQFDLSSSYLDKFLRSEKQVEFLERIDEMTRDNRNTNLKSHDEYDDKESSEFSSDDDQGD